MSLTHLIIASILIICTAPLHSFPSKKPISYLMIHPAGDARNTGRIINDQFERSICMQWAEQIQHAIAQEHPRCKVVLTRSVGQVVEPLHAAHFANRLNATLFISLHCYQESRTQPHIYLYHFSYGQDFITEIKSLALYPFDQAYMLNSQKTKQVAHHMHTNLKALSADYSYTLCGPYKLPLAPLIGITPPALMLEIGITPSTNMQQIVQAIAQAVSNLVETW